MCRWSVEKVASWWREQAWPVGCNYVTSDAVNDVEMWMHKTFNPELIGKELAIACDLGFNTVRVFLSYIVWKNERRIMEESFERFLEIAETNGIRVLPVLFDDCAFDFGAEARYEEQLPPVPGVHNSRWVPSPGFSVQDDESQLEACGEYVHAIVGAHREDDRILAWDLYNEAGNTGRVEKCMPLLERAFAWARKEQPRQPLTSCIWTFRGFEGINRFLIENSDVISLHCYTAPQRTSALLDMAEIFGRPVFITEWLNRPADNRYENHLSMFYKRKTGIWQWGMIVGKTQTNLSWATMGNGKPDDNPAEWQHDILYADGTPYRVSEIEYLKKFTKSGNV